MLLSEEFVAHGSSVTCLAFGQKSGRVMVTGAEDKKVNLWAIGKPNCIISLAGHSTNVESVKFGHNEDLVCAGSASGALKIWDLEVAKLLRTLTGHKGGVHSLDFHPYGDFLASGSLDSNIKLWDIRKKGWLHTYKGHAKDVHCLRFSPDGRWLASGGDEGVVKLWDLPAGKMLAELKDHEAAITDVAFHPNEFLLSTSSADGTVKFWDLETFQQVSTTVNDAGAILRIAYHPEGKVLFAAARDVLKVFQWEPTRTLDSLVMSWGKVKDMVVAGSQLIAGASSLTNVSVFVVDLKKVKPFAHSGKAKPAYVRDSPSRQSSRRSFVPGQCSTTHSQLESLESNKSEAETGTSDDAGDESSLAEIKSLGDFANVFAPSRELCRTPPKDTSLEFALPSTSASDLDFPRKLSDSSLFASLASIPAKINAGNQRQLSGMRSVECLAPPSILPASLDLPITSPSTPTSASGNQVHVRPHASSVEPLPAIAPLPSSPAQAIKQPVSGTTVTYANVENGVAYKAHISTSVFPQPRLAGFNKTNKPLKPESQVSMVRPVVNESKKPTGSATNGNTTRSPSNGNLFQRLPLQQQSVAPLQVRLPPQGPPRAAVVFPEPQAVRSKSPPCAESPVELVPEARDHPAGLDIDEFLPKHLQDTVRLGYHPQPEMSESEAMVAMVRGHKSLVTALSHRRKNIQIVLAMWSTKDARCALEQAIHMDDQSVIVDILNVITLKPAFWTLDMCQTLLPCIYELLQSKYECYMSVGCAALKLILKNFSTMIKTNITAPPGIGVDLSREERYNKCMSCYNQLLSVRAFILKRQTLQGKLGRSFRELSILMQNLE